MLVEELNNQLRLFQLEYNNAFSASMRNASKSRNKHLADMFKDRYAKQSEQFP